MDNFGSVNTDNLENEENFIDDSEKKELVTDSSSSRGSSLNGPSDYYKVVHIIFYFYGVTSLMPWTFFVTASDYWMYKFRDVNPHNFTIPLGRTDFQAEFVSYMNVSASASSTMCLILHSLIGNKWPIKLRLGGSLFLMTLLFILTTCFVQVNTDNWQGNFFIITMVIVFAINGASAIFTGCLFGIAGKLPPQYMTALVSGQALGGIIAAVAQILSLAFKVSSLHSALIYFLIADGMVITSFVSYFVLRRLPFFTFHLNQGLQSVTYNRSREVSVKSIFRKVWIYCLSIFLVFAITVAVYPSVTVLVVSHHKGAGSEWNNVYFVPVVNYFLFSCGDYCGRLMAGFLPCHKSGVIAIASGLRIIGIPLLMYCNAEPRHNLPVLIDSDVAFIAIIIIFAFTNGYLMNNNFVTAPRTFEENEKEKASSVMAAVAGIGICVGAAFSVMCIKLL